MSSLPPEEYESFRHIVLSVCDALRSKGHKPYSKPFEVSGEDFDSPPEAMKENLHALDNVSSLVLLYTSKEATSALIEVGYALKRGIPIVVFAQEGIRLPFYLRASNDSPHTSDTITIHTFASVDELPAVVAQTF